MPISVIQRTRAIGFLLFFKVAGKNRSYHRHPPHAIALPLIATGRFPTLAAEFRTSDSIFKQPRRFLFPPPLRGRVREGGKPQGRCSWLPPSPTLPRKGGESRLLRSQRRRTADANSRPRRAMRP